MSNSSDTPSLLSTLSKEEYLELEGLLKKCDPYTILKSGIQENKKEIREKYLNIKLELSEKEDNEGLELLEDAYKVISNEKFRNVYDEYLLQLELSKKKINDGINNIKNGSISSGLRLISVPFLNASLISNSTNTKSIQHAIEIIKSIYEKKGVSGFYRGFIFSTSTISIEFIRVVILEFINKFFIQSSKTGIKKEKDQVLSILDNLTYVLTGYPVKLITECLLLSPIGYSIFDVIKKVVLRQDLVNQSHFTFKNLYYGILYSMPLYFLNATIRKFVNFGVEKIQKYQENNKDNRIIKYSSMLITNPLSTSLIKTALTCPFLVLSSHYPSQLVHSFVNGLPVPFAINPISLAINLYKSNGVNFFFKGFIPQAIYRFCDTIGRRYNIPEMGDSNKFEVLFE